jgi:hypothetical protein
MVPLFSFLGHRAENFRFTDMVQLQLAESLSAAPRKKNSKTFQDEAVAGHNWESESRLWLAVLLGRAEWGCIRLEGTREADQTRTLYVA